MFMVASGVALRMAAPPTTAIGRRRRRASGPATSRSVLGILLAVLGAFVLFKSLTVETRGRRADRQRSPGSRCSSSSPRSRCSACCSSALGMVDHACRSLIIVIASLAGDEFQLERGADHAPSSWPSASWLVFVLRPQAADPGAGRGSSVIDAADRRQRHGPDSQPRARLRRRLHAAATCSTRFVGCLLGTLIGVLPGIGPVATIAMLLPSTYALPPRRRR